MRNFKIIVLVSLAIICMISKGFCTGKDKLSQAFYKANSYYEEGNYSEAITQYQSILNQEYESGNIYYNLGNCYYKQGNLAYALLYYEKARRFLPRDADLISNESYVRSLITKSYQEPGSRFLKRMVAKTFGKLNINEKVLLIFTANILIFLVLVLRLFFYEFRKYYLYPLFIICIICFFAVYSFAEEAIKIGKVAIVINKESAVNFEPADTATTYFNIYGGEKVEIIAEEKDWYKVRRLDAKSGWIKKDSIQII